jgi:hypothetical protein
MATAAVDRPLGLVEWPSPQDRRDTHARGGVRRGRSFRTSAGSSGTQPLLFGSWGSAGLGEAPRVQSWHTNRAPNARGCASPRPSLPAPGKARSRFFASGRHTSREPEVVQYGDLNQFNPRRLGKLRAGTGS